MPIRPIQFACLVLAMLQLLAAAVSSQGLMLCIHPDGNARLETAADALGCADEICPGDTTCINAWHCVDLPVGGTTAAAAGNPLRSHVDQIGPSHWQAVAAVLIPPSRERRAFDRAIDARDHAPDRVLDALAGVILVV